MDIKLDKFTKIECIEGNRTDVLKKLNQKRHVQHIQLIELNVSDYDMSYAVIVIADNNR